METPQPPKSRRRMPWILGGIVLLLLTLLVLLQSSNVWKNLSVDTASDTLLLYALSSLNFIAFVIFGFIFLRSIIKLARERRSFQLGSKIKTRLLIYFFAISVLPIIAMALFSYLFLNRALERWFTQIPEDVVREAREVQTRSATEQFERLQNAAKMLALTLDGQVISEAELNRLAEAGNLTRVEILSKDNRLLASSRVNLDSESDPAIAREIQLIRSGNFYDPTLQDGIGIDAIVANFTDGRKLLIVPNLKGGDSVSRMVDTSLAEFDRLKDQQITVRQIGLLTLGVLTFLLIFASTWTAFYIARGLTVPIKALAEGAGEIGRGNLGYKVDVLAEDELALLVSVFNEMSGKLEQNAAELRERRRYIETVLQSLPSGVISLDAENRVETINRAAANILKLEDGDFRGVALEQIVAAGNLQILERLLARARRIGNAAEQTVLKREGSDGRSDADAGMPAALIATALPDQNGAVLVIEDLSELIAAQRASAWQEVARRMAHEIKNPLTPIQLSAERIAKRFAVPQAETGPVGNVFPGGSDSKIIRDGTNTILREVESLKSMVDEFSRYARLPDARPETGDINEIARHVANLYLDRPGSVKIELRLDETVPSVRFDPEQIKRVFVNLIDNAIESFESTDEAGTVAIVTRHDNAKNIVLIEVADDGKGIDPADLQRLFQPYFSTKNRGTGLGLAIVKRIILEHEGKIYASANAPKGAKFSIELPVV